MNKKEAEKKLNRYYEASLKDIFEKDVKWLIPGWVYTYKIYDYKERHLRDWYRLGVMWIDCNKDGNNCDVYDDTFERSESAYSLILCIELSKKMEENK